MKVDDETIKAVEKVLREPVAAEFSDQAWKIRVNLIVASTIGLVMGLADLQIQPESSILGLRFAGLSNGIIRVTIAGIIAYLLFHFLWVAWDALLEWRLRVTGTRRGFVTGTMWESEHADVPVEPRQSTSITGGSNKVRPWGKSANSLRNLRLTVAVGTRTFRR